MPDEPKQRVSPMPPNCVTAESDHQPFKQARVFTFLGDEKLQRVKINRIFADLPACSIHQIRASTSLAQLEVRE
jgi:hypothetical protein